MNYNQEKYVAKGPLMKEAKDKLKLIIADKSVTPEKLNKRVQTEVIQPLIDAAIADLQNQIDSLEISGLALSNLLGYNPHIGISQKRITEEFDKLWSLIINDLIRLRFTVDKPEIYVGETTAVTFEARFAMEADSIQIVDSLGNVIASSEAPGSTFSYTHEILANEATELTFSAVATIGSITKTEELILPVRSINITQFDCTPTVVDALTTTNLDFVIKTSRKSRVELFVLNANNEEMSIWGPYPSAPAQAEVFSYRYTLADPTPGSLIFRVKAYNGNEVKTLDKAITVNDVNIEVTEFVVSPTTIYAGEEATLTFRGSISNGAIIKLFQGTTELYSTGNEDAFADSFMYSYKFTPNEAGTLNFMMKAIRGGNEVTQNVAVTVNEVNLNIIQFTADTDSLYKGEEETIHFTGVVSTNANLVLKLGDQTIQSWNNTTSISYDYVVNPDTVGNLEFKLIATRANKTADKIVTIPIIERKYAYIGGGATYQDVMIDANKTENFGKTESSTSTNYVFSTEAGDYMWFIFPTGTFISDMNSGGLSVPYTEITIEGDLNNSYNFYRSMTRVNAGTNNITVTFR